MNFDILWRSSELPVFEGGALNFGESFETFVDLELFGWGIFHVALWYGKNVSDLVDDVGESIKLSNWLLF